MRHKNIGGQTMNNNSTGIYLDMDVPEKKLLNYLRCLRIIT